MKKIVEIMGAVRGCQFANITYVADGGIPKKVISGVVTKLVTTSCQVNYSYESAVNNRLEKQGSERVFKAQSLPWGAWVEGFENKLIEHKGNLYLCYYDVANAKPKATSSDTATVAPKVASTNTKVAPTSITSKGGPKVVSPASNTNTILKAGEIRPLSKE